MKKYGHSLIGKKVVLTATYIAIQLFVVRKQGRKLAAPSRFLAKFEATKSQIAIM